LGSWQPFPWHTPRRTFPWFPQLPPHSYTHLSDSNPDVLISDGENSSAWTPRPKSRRSSHGKRCSSSPSRLRRALSYSRRHPQHFTMARGSPPPLNYIKAELKLLSAIKGQVIAPYQPNGTRGAPYHRTLPTQWYQRSTLSSHPTNPTVPEEHLIIAPYQPNGTRGAPYHRTSPTQQYQRSTLTLHLTNPTVPEEHLIIAPYQPNGTRGAPPSTQPSFIHSSPPLPTSRSANPIFFFFFFPEI